MKAILLISLLLLTACGTTPVKLKNPKTGDIVQCGPYAYTHSGAEAAMEHSCITDFKQQGYQRLPK